MSPELRLLAHIAGIAATPPAGFALAMAAALSTTVATANEAGMFGVAFGLPLAVHAGFRAAAALTDLIEPRYDDKGTL